MKIKVELDNNEYPYNPLLFADAVISYFCEHPNTLYGMIKAGEDIEEVAEHLHIAYKHWRYGND